MSTILNILGKIRDNDKYLTIDPATFGNGGPVGKPKNKDDAWRDELADLERRGVGSLPETKQAETTAKELEDQVEQEHRQLVNSAKKARVFASSEAYALSALERTNLNRQADRLEERAADLKANTRVRVAQAKALAQTCREWNPKKPRLLELRKRKAEVDRLLADASKTDTDKF